MDHHRLALYLVHGSVCVELPHGLCGVDFSEYAACTVGVSSELAYAAVRSGADAQGQPAREGGRAGGGLGSRASERKGRANLLELDAGRKLIDGENVEADGDAGARGGGKLAEVGRGHFAEDLLLVGVDGGLGWRQ